MFVDGKTEKGIVTLVACYLLPGCDLDLQAGRDLDSPGLFFTLHLIDRSSPLFFSLLSFALHMRNIGTLSEHFYIESGGRPMVSELSPWLLVKVLIDSFVGLPFRM
jgi:hypothetical protein